MQFLIVSGLSGAGKSRTASTLEDLGFYCVDNMPADLIGQFAQICLATKGRYEKVALVTDVRGGLTFDGLFKALDGLDKMGCEYSIVFVEASDEVIIKRFKETRRVHPLTKDGTQLMEAVRRERALMAPIRNRAAVIVDTSALTLSGLRSVLIRNFAGNLQDRSMSVNVVSFGFKYGLPLDADLVLDVRFLPNPYYIADLKELTGLDLPVHDFIFSYQQSCDFLDKVKDLLSFSLPLYVTEGKNNIVIAVGCTGGRHRSVAVSKALGEFTAKKGYATVISHRDMGRR
ncbi:MAG: RNase adapter RapZ [Oscillospiraceae bacterium]|nr:RNase adapter RapZ [Oscillospiraceae bacterium]